MITKQTPEQFYVVTNAGRAERDIAWFRKQVAKWQGEPVEFKVLENLALLALQGKT